MTEPNDLIKWLKDESKNKSFRQLEKELGLNHSTIHRIVNGNITDNRQSTLRKIEAAMRSRKKSFSPKTEESYVAIITNRETMTVRIETNICDHDEAISFVAFAISVMANNGKISESTLNAMISNTYRAVQDKRDKSLK